MNDESTDVWWTYSYWILNFLFYFCKKVWTLNVKKCSKFSKKNPRGVNTLRDGFYLNLLPNKYGCLIDEKDVEKKGRNQ